MFNAEMTREEAWTTLFSSIDGKSEDEVEKIKEEYYKVIPEIIKKELDGPTTAMTSYKF